MKTNIQSTANGSPCAALLLFLLICLGLMPLRLLADAPLLISHQGRIAVDGVNFDGTGYFKFAFVNANGTEAYWTNGGEPAFPDLQSEVGIAVEVTKGHYAITLGADGATISPNLFKEHSELYLRIWFNAEEEFTEDPADFEHLTPDRRITSSPFAIHATSASHADTATSAVNADFADFAEAANVADALGSSESSVISFQGNDAYFEGSAFVGADSGGLSDGAGPGIRLFYDSHASVEAGQIFAYDYTAGEARDLILQSPGGNVGIGTTDPGAKLHVAGTMRCETAEITSDRNKKSGFVEIDPEEILQKIASMPITNWHYKSNAKTRHIGPMAQDFHAAFGVGMDDKHISTVDADGVALAAIQALKSMIDQKDVQIEALERRLQALETKLGQ